MRLASGITYAAALLGLASESTAQSTVYQDPETGFTFSQYAAAFSIGTGATSIFYRVAIPSPAESPYDAVVQVVAPTGVGWAGLAWGGSMTNNPLTVAWANGQSATVSVRRATSHTAPTTYAEATLQLLTTGTSVNSTHWQYTAKCTGCTSFADKTLDPAGSNRLAWAYSKSPPSQPASADSAITVHDAYGYWNHDFAAAGNADFDSLVEENL